MAIPNCKPFGSARNSAQHPVLCNKFVADFMEKKGRTNGDEHDRHGQEKFDDPRRETEIADAGETSGGHEPKSEGKRRHGKAKMLFFDVAEVPQFPGVMFGFFPVSFS